MLLKFYVKLIKKPIICNKIIIKRIVKKYFTKILLEGVLEKHSSSFIIKIL